MWTPEIACRTNVFCHCISHLSYSWVILGHAWWQLWVNSFWPFTCSNCLWDCSVECAQAQMCFKHNPTKSWPKSTGLVDTSSKLSTEPSRLPSERQEPLAAALLSDLLLVKWYCCTCMQDEGLFQSLLPFRLQYFCAEVLMTAVTSCYQSSCHTVVGKWLIWISTTQQKIQFQTCSPILSAMMLQMYLLAQEHGKE